MNLPKIEAKFETTLAAKLASDGTSFTLTGHTDKNGAELSGLYSFLIDGENSSAEYITGTVSNGTVTITGRGLDYEDGVTEKAALKFEHTRGASVKITDFPVLGQIRNKLAGTETIEAIMEYAEDLTPTTDQQIPTKKYVDDLDAANVKKTGNQTIAGVKTFSSSPIVPTPTTDMQAATKKYVDDIAIAGGTYASATSPGISKLSIAPDSPSNPIALGSNEVAETGNSKVVRLKSNGKLNTTVLPTLTKGNIMVANGNSYDTALPVGGNGQVLMADSTTDTGIKWSGSVYSLVRDYLTHFRPLFWSMPWNVTVRLSFNNAKDSYRDFALWAIASTTLYYRYITRDSYDKFSANGMTLSDSYPTFGSFSLNGLYAVVPHGDYAYAFGDNGSGSILCRRFAVDTNAGTISPTTITIGSGGNNLSNKRVLFSDEYVFMTTTTANKWNKYSIDIDNKALVFVEVVDLPTGTDVGYIENGWWTYLPNTNPEEWVYFSRFSSPPAQVYTSIAKYTKGSISTKITCPNYGIYQRYSATNVSRTVHPILGIRDSVYELISLESYKYWDGGSVYFTKCEGIFSPYGDLGTFV